MTEPPAPPRVSARDLGIAGAYALATTATWAAHTSLTDVAGLPLAAPRPIALLLLVAASAAVALRRVRPGAMLLLTGGLGTAALVLDSGVGGFLLVFEAVFSAVLHGSRRLMRLVTVLCVGTTGVLLLATLVVVDLRSLGFAVSLQAFLVLILPLLWAGEVRGHREARAQAERAAAAEREAADRLLELEHARTALRLQEQRTHLAQELHDGVTGHLSAVALQTGALRSSAAHRADPEALDRSLEAVRRSALEAMADMRSLIDVLRTDGSEAAGAASWDSLIARLRALRPDAAIEIDDDAVAALERRGISAHALRIGQEAVTNLLKHSGPGPVRLSLGLAASSEPEPGSTPAPGTAAPDGAGREPAARRSAGPTPVTGARPCPADARDIVLHVDSPLPGTPAKDHGAGLGLPSMARRAAETGGSCQAGPTGQSQWRVLAVWPSQPSHRETRVPGDAAGPAAQIPAAPAAGPAACHAAVPDAGPAAPADAAARPQPSQEPAL